MESSGEVLDPAEIDRKDALLAPYGPLNNNQLSVVRCVECILARTAAEGETPHFTNPEVQECTGASQMIVSFLGKRLIHLGLLAKQRNGRCMTYTPQANQKGETFFTPAPVAGCGRGAQQSTLDRITIQQEKALRCLDCLQTKQQQDPQLRIDRPKVRECTGMSSSTTGFVFQSLVRDKLVVQTDAGALGGNRRIAQAFRLSDRGQVVIALLGRAEACLLPAPTPVLTPALVPPPLPAKAPRALPKIKQARRPATSKPAPVPPAAEPSRIEPIDYWPQLVAACQVLGEKATQANVILLDETKPTVPVRGSAAILAEPHTNMAPAAAPEPSPAMQELPAATTLLPWIIYVTRQRYPEDQQEAALDSLRSLLQLDVLRTRSIPQWSKHKPPARRWLSTLADAQGFYNPRRDEYAYLTFSPLAQSRLDPHRQIAIAHHTNTALLLFNKTFSDADIRRRLFLEETEDVHAYIEQHVVKPLVTFMATVDKYSRR